MSDSNRFFANDFSQVFEVRNGDGDPFLLIGGQAVNVWAERYVAVERELENFAPFTSEDIDFKGNKADVTHLAAQLCSVAKFPPKVAMTTLAGVIPIRVGAAHANIEIVRTVPAVTNELLEKSALTIDFEGKTIRVINPIDLVASKLNLASTISQEDRQDVHHLKIMILCARGFLRELLGAIEKGDIPPAGWLAAINTLHKLETSRAGKRVIKDHGVTWSYLPIPEISNAKNPKIVSFRETSYHAGTTNSLPPSLTSYSAFPKLHQPVRRPVLAERRTSISPQKRTARTNCVLRSLTFKNVGDEATSPSDLLCLHLCGPRGLRV